MKLLFLKINWKLRRERKRGKIIIMKKFRS
jgi:hypothetical protein